KTREAMNERVMPLILATQPAPHEHPVRDEIDDQDQRSQRRLTRPAQARGVEYRYEVVLHETAGVPRESRARAERVLELRQRADPAAVLDRHPPEGARHVRPDEAPPSPREETSEHHEGDECDVHEH